MVQSGPTIIFVAVVCGVLCILVGKPVLSSFLSNFCTSKEYLTELSSHKENAHDYSMQTEEQATDEKALPGSAQKDLVAFTQVHNSCKACNIIDTTKNNYDNYECIDMKFEPSTPICLYPLNADKILSKKLKEIGNYEPMDVKSCQDWLRMDEKMGFIDLGTNLGLYSLVAAAMDKNVVAVEPNPENVKHLHKAIKLGTLENRFVVLQNAISDKSGDIVKIQYSTDNQGDTRIKIGSNYTGSDERYFVKTIVLNDLLKFCKFDRAVMKMDIQGFEHRAFVQADMLFDSIDILYVLMEWDMMKKFHDPYDIALVKNMMDFFYSRGYTAQNKKGVNLQKKTWTNWPWNIA